LKRDEGSSCSGALGRCGKGAVELFQKIGVPEENIIKVGALFYSTNTEN